MTNFLLSRQLFLRLLSVLHPQSTSVLHIFNQILDFLNFFNLLICVFTFGVGVYSGWKLRELSLIGVFAVLMILKPIVNATLANGGYIEVFPVVIFASTVLGWIASMVFNRYQP